MNSAVWAPNEGPGCWLLKTGRGQERPKAGTGSRSGAQPKASTERVRTHLLSPGRLRGASPPCSRQGRGMKERSGSIPRACRAASTFWYSARRAAARRAAGAVRRLWVLPALGRHRLCPSTGEGTESRNPHGVAPLAKRHHISQSCAGHSVRFAESRASVRRRICLREARALAHLGWICLLSLRDRQHPNPDALCNTSRCLVFKASTRQHRNIEEDWLSLCVSAPHLLTLYPQTPCTQGPDTPSGINTHRTNEPASYMTNSRRTRREAVKLLVS